MRKAIILAAGEGTRMQSKKTKVLHTIAGKTLIRHVCDAVSRAGVEKMVVVLGRNFDVVAEEISSYPALVVRQPLEPGSPYGTGYAVRLALEHISPDDEVLIVYGDTPLISPDVLLSSLDHHIAENADITVLSAVLDDPKAYGRIIRENGEFCGIVEAKDLTDEHRDVREINSGIYLVRGSTLLDIVPRIGNNNAKKEYMLTDMIALALAQGGRVRSEICADTDMVLGVNDREDLLLCDQALRRRELRRRMREGVTIMDPDLTRIDADAEIAPDVTLEGYVRIEGPCIIRSGTRIVNSRITVCEIGEDCDIELSVLEHSVLGDRVKTGPYCHTRPGTTLKDDVKLGNFVEVKNATLGEGTKSAHLAYVGDADVGRGVNIGCGVVFVNYDGKSKHRTTVEDYGFIGSNANLVAPVTIGKNGFVAAGSTITEDVEEDALAIERANQQSVAGWVIKKGLHKGESK